MEDNIFVEILKKAIMGDPNSIQDIIEEYGNIINKYSCRNGRIDEDCKQYIKMKIVENIGKFKNFE